ncbi:MAG: class I SAM-dependent DNA methyltransferase, partial [Actinomycetaceae bacterium]|nr:class I SAM-dependent DNA methyltransferase [Actinomycetaceae bacterium]
DGLCIKDATTIDPACGSGNFLTETYIQLRTLENRVLESLTYSITGTYNPTLNIETGNRDADLGIKVSINQFYGIEINDYACEVAKTAMWIAEQQMMDKTQEILAHHTLEFLPLTSNTHIHHANALRIDWNDVLPAERCKFIIGNPPFIGYSKLDDNQKEDRATIFGKVKTVDYVACWYWKAAAYMTDCPIRTAFVSTNSICQGQQVEPIWKPLFEQGFHIDFAHQTFKWISKALDSAQVYVIIVGFSRTECNNKTIFFNHSSKVVNYINGYLMDIQDIWISNRRNPLSQEKPAMVSGLKPADHGWLLLRTKEKNELITAEPQSKKFIRDFIGSDELYKGKPRYCLWLLDYSLEELRTHHPLVWKRVEQCHQWRSEQQQTGDAYNLRESPHLLRGASTVPITVKNIFAPQMHNEQRSYMPIEFIDNAIPSNSLYFISNANIYHFGVLTSQFYNAWIRAISGSLGPARRHNNTIVYNNFIWPNPTPEQKKHIEECAQAVLDARENPPGRSLAQMYDGISPLPDNPSASDLKKYNQLEYADLKQAHLALDAAVEAAYGVDFNGDEEKIVAHLFTLYAEATKDERK